MLSTFENILGTGLFAKAAMVAIGAVVVVSALRLIGGGAASAGEIMSAAEAHAKAMKGEITLVDVRTPDEWKQTGVPASAHTITMHQAGPQFVKELDQVLGGDRTKPLAIICRTGARTTMLQGQLMQIGFTNVLNVAEGMLGGFAGPGWRKTGLPTRMPGEPVETGKAPGKA